MSVPLSDTHLVEPAYGVVFDHPDHDRVYAWGPFVSLDMAARFAMFVRSEIDPAKVIPWPEATDLPGVRVVDPVAELLSWSTTVAQRQTADACPADCPCRSTPLPARWDKTVVHPTPGDTECPDTLVCCVAATGQPVALWLDDEHREALGLALLDPNGEMDQADDNEWAEQLQSADLTPHPAWAWCSTTSGYEVAAQVATTDALTAEARERLLAELQVAFDETVRRVLGYSRVETEAGQ